MYPRLVYTDELAALEYLTRVFQFTERREARMGSDERRGHARLARVRRRRGDDRTGVRRGARRPPPLQPGRGRPRDGDDQRDVNDIDAHYAHAVAEGATITMPIEDAFYGYRRYEADDLEGHHWHFHEPLEAIRRHSARGWLKRSASDSNPRTLAGRRLSRPLPSSTRPPLPPTTPPTASRAARQAADRRRRPIRSARSGVAPPRFVHTFGDDGLGCRPTCPRGAASA